MEPFKPMQHARNTLFGSRWLFERLLTAMQTHGGLCKYQLVRKSEDSTGGMALLMVFTRCCCYRVAKRTLDIVLSAAILLCSAPILLLIWVYIRCHSSGPVIFRQIRIKKNRRVATRKASAAGNRCCKEDRRKRNSYGEPFVFYKFATMYPDARERFPELYAYDYAKSELDNLVFKLKNDPRVPPWARWLRQSSLDELPNFYNVLRGDMTLVGPRPDIPEMVQYYTEDQHKAKLSVMPGVTGFAQILGRGDLSFQDTLAYDLDYVRNASFSLDLKILVLTFLKLFKGRSGGAF